MINIINQIISADWLKVSPFIPDNSIDLIIVDVPFGVEFKKSKFFNDSKDYVFSNAEKWLSEMYRVLKEHSHCYIYVPTLEIDKWIFFVKKSFKYNNLLNASTYTTNRYIKNNYPFDSQYIIYCSKLKARRLNKVNWIETSESWKKDKRNLNPKNFTYQYTSRIPKKYRANIKPNAEIKLLHPNQKNEELISYLMLMSSNEEEIILDCFCGVGSVLKVAKERNRKYIAIDNNKEYINITKKRIKNIKLLKRYRYLTLSPYLEHLQKQMSLSEFI